MALPLIAAGLIAGGQVSNSPGATHFVINDSDVQAIREVRAGAAARIAEMREELAVLEGELAVLDEALEELDEAPKENVRDG